MDIRHIRLEDAEQFANLLTSVDASNMMLFEPGERRTSIDQEEKRIESILMQSNSTIMVADDNGILAGYVAVHGGQGSRNRHSAHLVVGVREQYRGQGIATRMIKEVFRWAKEAGLDRLGLTVIKDNDRALNLYKKLGFQTEGEKIHSLMINGQPVNEYYLYILI